MRRKGESEEKKWRRHGTSDEKGKISNGGEKKRELHQLTTGGNAGDLGLSGGFKIYVKNLP